MRKVRNFKSAVALGSLTATVALLTGLASANAQTANGTTVQAAPSGNTFTNMFFQTDSPYAPSADAAADATDGQVAQGAATAPGGGSFPGSFLVPGTNTSFKVGGYAKLQINESLQQPMGQVGDGSAMAVGPNPTRYLHNQFQMQGQESRFNFETRTPTSYGELKTFIELDFYGAALQGTGVGSVSGPGVTGPATASVSSAGNNYLPRIRHAYGTLGPLLIGQYFSNWFDTDTFAEEADGGMDAGEMTYTTQRLPQIRYTYLGPQGTSVAVSVEEPATQLTNLGGQMSPYVNANIGPGATYFWNNQLNGGGGYFAPNAIQTIPNFVATARIDQPWGHLALHGLAVNEQVDTQAITPAGSTMNLSKTGWGVQLSGHVNVIGKDVVRFEAQMGDGIGIYMQDTNGMGIETNSAANGTINSAVLPRSYGAFGTYQHWWTDTLRSNVTAGIAYIENAGFMTASPLAGVLSKRDVTSHFNLFWSPVPQADLGIEYMWEHRQTINNFSGIESSIIGAAKWKF